VGGEFSKYLAEYIYRHAPGNMCACARFAYASTYLGTWGRRYSVRGLGACWIYGSKNTRITRNKLKGDVADQRRIFSCSSSSSFISPPIITDLKITVPQCLRYSRHRKLGIISSTAHTFSKCKIRTRGIKIFDNVISNLVISYSDTLYSPLEMFIFNRND